MLNIYNQLLEKKEKLAVIGLGYVGMPIAVEFSKKINVIGFDINKEKIELYKSGIDMTREVGNQEISKCTVDFTCEENRLKEAKFHIIAVPTPIKKDKTPDLVPIKEASRVLGKNLTRGAIVVYESTVYPGVTEEICIPILEKESGLICGEDFKVGYSPERINPGDKIHRLETIVKVVSGIDKETLEIIAKVYELVVKAGVFKAESIKVAEAAKVIENSQRDINIAFMNELSIIFNKMGIDTKSILEAALTKWNFLDFKPGLVGGHCIGVDPYYLTYKAEQLGYHSQIILSGRRINDDMGKYVVENVLKNILKAEISVKEVRVAVLGFSFKENCPDTRNTKVINIINELEEYGINAIVVDPEADKEEVKLEYGIELKELKNLKDMDVIIVAVGHNQFTKLSKNDFNMMFRLCENEKKILIDLKGLYKREEYLKAGFKYWRL